MKATLATEMQLLSDLASSIAMSLNLKETLKHILVALDAHLGFQRGTIVLPNPGAATIRVEGAPGPGARPKNQCSDNFGARIIGQVLQTGEPIVVSDTSGEPRFFHKSKVRDIERSKKVVAFCVPIRLEGRTVGALSVDHQAARGKSVDPTLRLLNVVATLVAQAIKLNNVAELEQASLRAENAQLRQEIRTRFAVDNTVGRSPAMQQVFRGMRQAAAGSTAVLIRGECGTGRNFVAHAIHCGGVRADKPFIRVNCLTLPGTLLDSELFGHEKGAFAGAVERKLGWFERARGGTIFLDEIGDFPPSLQVKLLRVIQSQEFERVGGSETIKANVRVIAATHKNLEHQIAAGGALPDLLHNVNMFPLCLPPLRERREDILLLANHFLRRLLRGTGKPIAGISTSAIEALMCYHWPGNVRELENCMERAVLVCEEDMIRAEHLPPSLRMIDKDERHAQSSFPEIIANMERELIVNALRNCGGQQRRAAVELGITTRMLGYRIRKYGIQPRQI
ncbi:MAG: sigma 54-interacting transcriptional regulator [Planctomycetes bacterium]|nr:sigma 54-interacting transcriptional regulator [Planctomycetota bacterium]